MYTSRKRIVISKHARERLAQRLPQVNPNQYNLIVSNARYLGTTPSKLSAEVSTYINRITKSKSSILRLYKDNVFVFRGKGNGHQLVTVFPLKDKYMPECLSG